MKWEHAGHRATVTILGNVVVLIQRTSSNGKRQIAKRQHSVPAQQAVKTIEVAVALLREMTFPIRATALSRSRVLPTFWSARPHWIKPAIPSA
jgi:hypothetical protein